MTTVHPYLALNNTKKALDYYKEVLAATNIHRITVSEEKAEQFGVPVEKASEMTMHSQFDVLGTTIMAADNFRGDHLSYTGVSILLELNSEDEIAMTEAKTFWNLVANSGRVTINLPFEEQFWGGAMGDFTDEFGVQWMLHAQPYSQLSQTLGTAE